MSKPAQWPEVINVRIPSRLELLGVLDRVAQTICERLELTPEEATKVTMSVIEAGTNAIQHGHQRDASKPLDTEFQVYEDRIVIVVRDLGPGFDISLVNGDITSPEHLLDLRGRGIYIMRQCMDTVDFEFTPHGTICRMVKHLSPAARAAGA